MMKVLYTTQATSTGGRDGQSKTDDGLLAVKLATPKELGGMGGATNPEQLFAAGYSACFIGALKFVAQQQKVTLPADLSVTAKVGIGARDDGEGFGITADLTVNLPGIERSVAENLVERAHKVCPYSHATRGNIPLSTSIA